MQTCTWLLYTCMKPCILTTYSTCTPNEHVHAVETGTHNNTHLTTSLTKLCKVQVHVLALERINVGLKEAATNGWLWYKCIRQGASFPNRTHPLCSSQHTCTVYMYMYMWYCTWLRTKNRIWLRYVAVKYNVHTWCTCTSWNLWVNIM